MDEKGLSTGVKEDEMIVFWKEEHPTIYTGQLEQCTSVEDYKNVEYNEESKQEQRKGGKRHEDYKSGHVTFIFPRPLEKLKARVYGEAPFKGVNPFEFLRFRL